MILSGSAYGLDRKIQAISVSDCHQARIVFPQDCIFFFSILSGVANGLAAVSSISFGNRFGGLPG